jgi:hypothetical protein
VIAHGRPGAALDVPPLGVGASHYKGRVVGGLTIRTRSYSIQSEFNVGFSDAKRKLIAALLSGDYSHEGRADIDHKNLLQTGSIAARELADLLRKSSGSNYSCSPHHQDSAIDVHVVVCRGWYVKFYFDPDTVFISVHR